MPRHARPQPQPRAGTPPSVGRPAHGFGTLRAQKWILASAVFTATIYMFRRLVSEAGVQPAKGAKHLAGAGTPPPPLSQFAVAWLGGYFLLGLLALAAPEVAASFAMLALAGSALTNGVSLFGEISTLEHAQPVTANVTPTTPTSQAVASAANPVTPLLP